MVSRCYCDDSEMLVVEGRWCAANLPVRVKYFPPNTAFEGIYKRVRKYSNNAWHIFINVILINLFIQFHPSTMYSPDTNRHFNVEDLAGGNLWCRHRLECCFNQSAFRIWSARCINCHRNGPLQHWLIRVRGIESHWSGRWKLWGYQSFKAQKRLLMLPSTNAEIWTRCILELGEGHNKLTFSCNQHC